mgnify:CR=1 FL=1
MNPARILTADDGKVIRLVISRKLEEETMALTPSTMLELGTPLPMDEVRRLSSLQGADIREAKRVLAHEVTRLLHGEALALGLPVVVSYAGALPERVGEAGRIVTTVRQRAGSSSEPSHTSARPGSSRS